MHHGLAAFFSVVGKVPTDMHGRHGKSEIYWNQVWFQGLCMLQWCAGALTPQCPQKRPEKPGNWTARFDGEVCSAAILTSNAEVWTVHAVLFIEGAVVAHVTSTPKHTASRGNNEDDSVRSANDRKLVSGLHNHQNWTDFLSSLHFCLECSRWLSNRVCVMAIEFFCHHCGSGMAQSRSRWWIDNKVICCLLLFTVMTFPPCLSLDDTSIDQNHVQFFWAIVNVTYTDSENKLKTETFQGKYGSKSLVQERIGLAVHVRTKNDNKTHGCEEYGNKIPSEKWIAVVERGTCYFTEKIKIATEKHNASAVVIYNSDDTGFTIMQHSGE